MNLSLKTKGNILVFISGLLLVAALFFLMQIFSGSVILPQLLFVGPLVVHYYGIIMATAAAAGFYFAMKRAPQYEIGFKQAEDLLFWLVIGGLIGARIYHVLSAGGYYFQHPADIFKVWNGGLSIYGAVLGGFFTIWLFKKTSNLKPSILVILDWLAPSLLLGQIIGRFGNLFNYEAFGYPTNLPWKMFVPLPFRPLAFEQFSFFHPFFLYELLGNLIILWFLLKVLKPKANGQLFFSYLLLYNALRFALEFFRIDSTFIGIFRLNAIVSLVLVVGAIRGLRLCSNTTK